MYQESIGFQERYTLVYTERSLTLNSCLPLQDLLTHRGEHQSLRCSGDHVRIGSVVTASVCPETSKEGSPAQFLFLLQSINFPDDRVIKMKYGVYGFLLLLLVLLLFGFVSCGVFWSLTNLPTNFYHSLQSRKHKRGKKLSFLSINTVSYFWTEQKKIDLRCEKRTYKIKQGLQRVWVMALINTKEKWGHGNNFSEKSIFFFALRPL
jgi:hypothetical protein